LINNPTGVIVGNLLYHKIVPHSSWTKMCLDMNPGTVGKQAGIKQEPSFLKRMMVLILKIVK